MSEPTPTTRRSSVSPVDVYDGSSEAPSSTDAPGAGARFRPRFRFHPRAWRLPLVLFLATCCTTFLAGALEWNPQIVLEQAAKAALDPLVGDNPLAYPFHVPPPRVVAGPKATVDPLVDDPFTRLDDWDRFQPSRVKLAGGIERGLWYAALVLLILMTHEMGHYIASLVYRVPASLPLVIPLPLLSPIGTLGAVILTDPRKSDRRALFDIGIAGPLAGLAVCLPVLAYGLWRVDFSVGGAGPSVELPLLARQMLAILQPNGYHEQTWVHLDQLNPWLMAGWVGFLVTGLNMMPVSQLDGGHVTHGLFGRDARWLGRGFMVVAALACVAFGLYHWFLMLALVTFIGVDHPPTSDDEAPLGAPRYALGLLSLTIPVLCFPPHVIAN